MATSPIPVATLDPAGGAPEVEIVVGHLHTADYQFLLFDTHGANPVPIGTPPDGKGKTGDPEPDRFALPGAVPALHRRTIFWQAGLASFLNEGATQPFQVTVRVLQDGKILATGGGVGAMERPHLSGLFHLKVPA
jgi:hypothetical protein